MRILLIGANGFIGSSIARRLMAIGRPLRLAVRDVTHTARLFPGSEIVRADLNHLLQPADWAPLLDGCDAVVNASGLLQDGAGDSVQRIQRDAVIALNDACAMAGVRRIVQISAAGLDGNASDFMRTKAAADSALLAGPVPAVVLRPGLVIGRNAYGGTQLIRMAAALPAGLLPPFGEPIRCIALDDVADAVVVALDRDVLPAQPVELVSEEALSLDRIIRAHRRWLDLGDWRRIWTVPSPLLALATAASDLAGMLGWRSPLRRNAIAALANGVDGDAQATTAWLGRKPLTLGEALAAHPSGKQDRLMAWSTAMLPAALAALVAMWLLSGIGTFVHFEAAHAIMASTGVGGRAATLLAGGGAVADILLASMLLVRRWSRVALVGMILLAAAYLAAGTLLLPGLWLDPLAPFAKVLPTMALAALLLPLLDSR